jgi:hypothetical protein
MEKEIKRGLVVSGGGAWGAYGAGLLAGLNKKYDVIAGISTGALMSPLVALNEFDILEEAYTSVSDKDIFDLKWYKPNPVKKNGKLSILAVLYALIAGNESLATANNMRKLIDKFVTEDQYNRIRENGTNVIVGAQNLKEKPSRLHYFDVLEQDFEDFKDWMWASAVAPFYCNLVEKEWTDENGDTHMGQWTDGGVTELVSLGKVLDVMRKYRGVEREVDVIIHRSEPEPNFDSDKVCNLIDNVTGVINAMRYDIEFENVLERAERFAKKRNATVNIYFLPRKLSANAMVFNKQQMKSWWEEGYNSIGDETKVITFKPNS